MFSGVFPADLVRDVVFAGRGAENKLCAAAAFNVQIQHKQTFGRLRSGNGSRQGGVQQSLSQFGEPVRVSYAVCGGQSAETQIPQRAVCPDRASRPKGL